MTNDSLKIISFLSKIKASLNQELPGAAAHIQMAPPAREELFKNGNQTPADAKKASVLIPLYFKDGTLHTAFIRRQQYDGVHSGQIAFPGGRKEEFDKDDIATALREAQEEVGIIPNQTYVLGSLSPLYIPPSHYLITPVVAYLSRRPAFVPEEKEVKEIIEIPVKEFLRNEMTTKIKIDNNPKPFWTPCYQIGNANIWGATAMVISEFLQISLKINR